MGEMNATVLTLWRRKVLSVGLYIRMTEFGIEESW
jgi:hypothetical protein